MDHREIIKKEYFPSKHFSWVQQLTASESTKLVKGIWEV